MKKSLVDILIDPASGTSLKLEGIQSRDEEEIVTGRLRSKTGAVYEITAGIPRFVMTEDAGQRQTEGSFGYKWRQQSINDSPSARRNAQNWLVERYNFGTLAQMQAYFSRREYILDAGCGSGFSTSMWMEPDWQKGGSARWVGVDISEAVDVARERLGAIPGTHFVQGDLLQLPLRAGVFDTIFSEGVLHHTPSTERALKATAALLKPGGEILFYVYRQKGPVREFSDDYIRDVVSDLDPEKAWELLRPLTHLSKALAELKTEIHVPEDIPYLGIKAGNYDVQRLIYWHFMKLFWDEGRTFEENHAVNFDWYHPRYAHRQTEAEIRQWCAEVGLTITYFNTQESGYTVRAMKG